MARDAGMGLEQAGRLLRQRFFSDLSLSGNAIVLTGHHAGDQVETILMCLCRGAHRRGLGGMREFTIMPVPPDRRIAIGRPLLGFSRGKIALHAHAYRLEWREDASNSELAFVRNRVRHKVIPLLDALLPGVGERLLVRAAALAREEDELVRQGEELARRFSRREAGGRFLALPEGIFFQSESLNYVLRQVLEEETGGRLADASVLSRLAELAINGNPGQALALPGRLQARRERAGVFFHFPEKSLENAGVEIILPEPPFAISAAGFAVAAEWRPIAGPPPLADSRDPGVEWLNPLGVGWPLCLRSPRRGERFQPLGAPGSRKIQDILVDMKVPRHRRNLPIVLADSIGPLWLWPCRLAHRVRLDGGRLLQALRVSIREEAPGKPER
jgi:tRNA(Ile)-lysidine synthase